MAEKIWKWWQDRLKERVTEMATTRPWLLLRLQDTHSARGQFLPAQPSDFLLATPAGAFAFEAKSSQKYDCLEAGLSTLMEKGQAAYMRLWCRTENPAAVAFYSKQKHWVEIWDGLYVAEKRAEGKKLARATGLICEGPYADLEQLVDTMVERAKQ